LTKKFQKVLNFGLFRFLGKNLKPRFFEAISSPDLEPTSITNCMSYANKTDPAPPIGLHRQRHSFVG